MLWVLSLAFGSFVLLGGCTSPNPKNCSDKTCSDPAFPFCDVDGSLQGTPEVCIAVGCVPREFEQCRGDAALVCSATGDTFDVLVCPKGCNATNGCNECATNSECGGTAPVCDTNVGTCVACTADAQCASQVCNTSEGSCVDTDQIAYASPQGTGNICSQQSPCKLVDAIAIARVEMLRKTVRLAPGEYRQSVVIPSGTLTVVGDAATIFGDPGSGEDIFAVTGTAEVTVRGVDFDTTRASVRCSGTPGQNPGLRLENVVLAVNGVFANGLFLNECIVELRKVETRELTSEISRPVVAVSVTLNVFDSHFYAASAQGGVVALGGRGSMFRFVNTLFENITVIYDNRDDGSTLSRLGVAFCTGTGGIYASDTSTEFSEATIENSIFTAPSGNDAVGGRLARFTLRNNVLFVQAATVDTSNIVADPQFKNTSGRDFSLGANSPAIDRAVPSNISPTADIIGTPRPQGPKHDIGAYEYVAP